jgi:putative MFS transporter
MNLPERLDRLPLSRPHYRLLWIGGLGYTFDGMDAAVVAFLLTSVQAVWHLGNAELGMVGSTTLVGYLFGATAAGLLGDRFGRRAVMMGALAFYAAFSVAAALAPNFPAFLAMRVLAGVGTGAESAIIAPFLAEFVPARRRGWFVGALAGFFSFGWVTAALIGRFVVPASDSGWRVAQLLTAVPIVMLLWWRRALPESPRFLLAAGRPAEAEAVVVALERDVEAATGRPLPPLPSRSAGGGRAPAAATPARAVTLASALRFLWSPAMAGRTAVTWLLWFVIAFSYYGFFTWIPTLLVQRGITVTRSFDYAIVIYLAQVPGYFSAAWACERIDRKNTIALYLGASAVCAFWLSRVDTGPAITLAGAALSFCLNGTFAGIYSYTPEVFPTWVRASGMGLSSSFGRIGGILAPLLIGYFSARLGFAGVFGLTTLVLATGVVSVLVFGLSTAGHSLEELSEGALPAPREPAA